MFNDYQQNKPEIMPHMQYYPIRCLSSDSLLSQFNSFLRAKLYQHKYSEMRWKTSWFAHWLHNIPHNIGCSRRERVIMMRLESTKVFLLVIKATNRKTITSTHLLVWLGKTDPNTLHYGPCETHWAGITSEAGSQVHAAHAWVAGVVFALEKKKKLVFSHTE